MSDKENGGAPVAQPEIPANALKLSAYAAMKFAALNAESGRLQSELRHIETQKAMLLGEVGVKQPANVFLDESSPHFGLIVDAKTGQPIVPAPGAAGLPPPALMNRAARRAAAAKK